MNNDHPGVRRLRFLEVCATFYLLVVVGRLIYEGLNSRGIYGWLADEQMQRLGHFDLKLTLLGAATVYLLPVSFVFSFLKRARARLAPARSVAPGLNDALREAVNTARLLILLGLGFALAGGVGYYYMAWQNGANARRRVERFPVEALATLSAAEAARLKFVEVSATCQTRAGYGWTKTDQQLADPKTHHRCLPLTEADWRPGQPVRFFLQTTVEVYYAPDENGPPILPQSFDGEPFAGSFEGELKRETLPRFASSALQQAGVLVASPYYVLEHQTLHGKPRILSRQEMLLPPLLGGFFGFLFFLAGALMYGWRRGYAARIAARRGWSTKPGPPPPPVHLSFVTRAGTAAAASHPSRADPV